MSFVFRLTVWSLIEILIAKTAIDASIQGIVCDLPWSLAFLTAQVSMTLDFLQSLSGGGLHILAENKQYSSNRKVRDFKAKLLELMSVSNTQSLWPWGQIISFFFFLKVHVKCLVEKFIVDYVRASHLWSQNLGDLVMLRLRTYFSWEENFYHSLEAFFFFSLSVFKIFTFT